MNQTGQAARAFSVASSWKYHTAGAEHAANERLRQDQGYGQIQSVAVDVVEL